MKKQYFVTADQDSKLFFVMHDENGIVEDFANKELADRYCELQNEEDELFQSMQKKLGDDPDFTAAVLDLVDSMGDVYEMDGLFQLIQNLKKIESDIEKRQKIWEEIEELDMENEDRKRAESV